MYTSTRNGRGKTATPDEVGSDTIIPFLFAMLVLIAREFNLNRA